MQVPNLDNWTEPLAVRPGPAPPIVVVGDSITKGVSYDECRGRHVILKGQDFCSLVGAQLKSAIENLSKFGCVSGAAMEILIDRLKKPGAPKPALVAFELGGNDCDFDWDAIALAPEREHAPKVSLEEYAQNLTMMIKNVYDAGSQPILLNLPPIDPERYFRFFTGGNEEKAQSILKWLGNVSRIYWWHERYNAAVEWVAQKTGTPLLMIRSALLRDMDYRHYVSGDGLHPNAEGHKRIAQQVMDYVRCYQPALLA